MPHLIEFIAAGMQIRTGNLEIICKTFKYYQACQNSSHVMYEQYHVTTVIDLKSLETCVTLVPKRMIQVLEILSRFPVPPYLHSALPIVAQNTFLSSILFVQVMKKLLPRIFRYADPTKRECGRLCQQKSAALIKNWASLYGGRMKV